MSSSFPTGNIKVDLRLQHKSCSAVLEIKSLGAARELEAARHQAAVYAAQQKLGEATLAVFLPTANQDALSKIEGTSEIAGVLVHTVAIGWRP